MTKRRIVVCWLSLTILAIAGFGQGLSGETEQQPAPPAAEEGKPLPGVELARAITTTTGIAISPLFGASAVGAWRYFRSDDAARVDLPWFASPWFWAPGLLVVLLLVLKDPLLGLVPGAKKGFDALEVVENKASAVAVAPALVPMFVRTFSRVAEHDGAAHVESTVQSAGLSLQGLLQSLPSPVVMGLGTVIFLATFFCVWMAFHAINVLILLSPFGFLDMFLRAIKFVVLATLLAATLVHPYAGMAVALLIIAISIPIAGWSFRLTVFGMTVAWDLLTLRHRRVAGVGERIRAFSTSSLPGPPARTFGAVVRREDRCVFEYRPYLILPTQVVELPRELTLGRALVCSMLVSRAEEEEATVVRLAPRYRGHHGQVVQVLELDGLEDLPLLRGIKSLVAWIKETAGRGRKRIEEAVGA